MFITAQNSYNNAMSTYLFTEFFHSCEVSTNAGQMEWCLAKLVPLMGIEP